jgi:vitamin B12 transporter
MQTRYLLTALILAVPVSGLSQEEIAEQELMVVTASASGGIMQTRYLLTALILAVPVTGLSQEEIAEQELMVVTASRGEEALSEALVAISVITSEDIQLSQAEDLTDLLRLEAGVDVVRSGSAGAQTSVFMRGTNSNHTLVLVDGVRVSSANSGAALWEHLPLNQIERIEIVRGPRAGVYGSDAMGGVIQIFTNDDTQSSVRITGGSFGSSEITANVGYERENGFVSLGIGARSSDGQSAQNIDGYSYDPDDDGYDNQNLLLSGGWNGSHGEWSFGILAIDADIEFDQGVSTASQEVASLGFASESENGWQQQYQFGYAGDDIVSDFGFFTSAFESGRWDASWQNQLMVGTRTNLVFGVDYYREEGKNDSAYDESRNNTGLYTGMRTSRQGHDFEASLRYDDNSEFGSEFTGQLAWGTELGETTRLIASYGTAFRAPNLSEQFSPGFGGFFAGNPDLQPESSTSVEIGLRWQPDSAHQASFNVYMTDVEDLIVFSGRDFQAININEAEIRGVELGYQWRTAAWKFTGNMTFQDTEDRSTGNSLLRRPDEKLALGLDRIFANGSWLGAEFFYSGTRADFGASLKSYQLFNIRAGLPLTDKWQLEARLENALDEAYQPAQGFNGMGRAGFLSLSWQPGG